MSHHPGPAAGGANPVPPGPVRVPAPAKVNLFLEVLGKRPDGYHEIATLMVAIDLMDELEFVPTADSGIVLSTDVAGLTTGPDNLVVKAAERLRAATGCKAGAAIHLSKRVPWAAGLGGGSSDAAAALVGLNALWRLGLPRDELGRIGADLGSDVPFFLNGPAAWCTGRGEVVESVPIGRPIHLVLVKPPEGLGTPDVYRRVVVPAAPRDGSAAKDALANGDTAGLGRALHNRLQEPAFELAPAVADWHRRLKTAGAEWVLLSGSGSCLFALCRDAAEARQVHDDLTRGWASGAVSPARTFLVRSRP